MRTFLLSLALLAIVAASCRPGEADRTVRCPSGQPQRQPSQEPANHTQPSSQPQPRLTLFDFETHEQFAAWRPISVTGAQVCDGARIASAPGGVAEFAGDLTAGAAADGAGVRADVAAAPLGEYVALAMRVRGDGRAYRLIAKTNPADDGYMYMHEFTPPQQWQEITVPFGRFEPVFQGMPLRFWPRLDPAAIVEIGVMIFDSPPGRYRLEIDWIEAHR